MRSFWLNPLALWVWVSSASLSVSLWANVGGELERAFTHLGGLSNTTPPSAYQAQSAGFYNGGSLYLRSPVHNTQLAHVSLPSWSGGCSGIDLHMGGFSFITKGQARDLAKNIMNDSMSYAFNLALETTAPMLANTFKDLRNVANAINRSNINSCEMATGLVGSVFPKMQAAQKAVCQDIGTGSGGAFGDYASARMGCGNGGQKSVILENAANHKGYEKTLASNMNFAWKAIKNNAFVASNNEVAQLFMSITGTFIVKHEGDDDGANSEIVLPSLLDKEDLLSALLHGGSAKAYSCDTLGQDGCLSPAMDTLKILEKESLIYQVEKTINDIVTKIKADTGELSDKEKGFLQSTRLPIYKMMNVQSALTQNKSVLDIASYSELIASDILFHHLETIINLVETEYQTLSIPSELKEQFQSALRLGRSKIKALKQDNYHHQMISMQLIEQTLLIEQRLANNLAKMEQSNRWADSL